MSTTTDKRVGRASKMVMGLGILCTVSGFVMFLTVGTVGIAGQMATALLVGGSILSLIGAVLATVFR